MSGGDIFMLCVYLGYVYIVYDVFLRPKLYGNKFDKES